MTMTKSQAIKLSGLLREVRPDWDAPGVMAALGKLADRSLPDVIVAMTTAAADEGAQTPMAGVSNPLYWPNWGKAQAANHPTRDPAYLRMRAEHDAWKQQAASPERIASIRAEYGLPRKASA